MNLQWITVIIDLSHYGRTAAVLSHRRGCFEFMVTPGPIIPSPDCSTHHRYQNSCLRGSSTSQIMRAKKLHPCFPPHCCLYVGGRYAPMASSWTQENCSIARHSATGSAHIQGPGIYPGITQESICNERHAFQGANMKIVIAIAWESTAALVTYKPKQRFKFKVQSMSTTWAPASHQCTSFCPITRVRHITQYAGRSNPCNAAVYLVQITFKAPIMLGQTGTSYKACQLSMR